MGWLKDKKEEFKREFNNALSEKSSKLEKEGKYLPLKSKKESVKLEGKLSKKEDLPNKTESDNNSKKGALINTYGLNLNDYLTKQVFYVVGSADDRSFKEVAYDKNVDGVELALYIVNRGYNKIEKYLKYILKNVYIFIAYIEVLVILLIMTMLDKDIILIFGPLSAIWISYCFYIYYKEMKSLKNNIDELNYKDDNSEDTIN